MDVGGLAVGGKGHDLVLVGRAQKPEMVRDLFVHEAEGVGQVLHGKHLQVAAAARPARWEADSPRPSRTSTLESRKGAARWADAAWAT